MHVPDVLDVWRYGVVSWAVHHVVWLCVFGAFFVRAYVWKRNLWHPFKYNPKYPKRPLILRELKRSLYSLQIVTLWDVAIRLLQGYGFAPLLDWQERFQVSRVPSYLFLLVAAVLWADAHFYWIHRLLHVNRWLYKRVHSHHHESFNPDPMSALSFHPVEGILYFSSLLFVFVFPMPGWAYHLMRLLLIVTPFAGHSGHGLSQVDQQKKQENLAKWNSVNPHYIHHVKFHYNFGSGLLPYWDRFFGTEWQPADESCPSTEAVEQARLAGLDLK
eukprot:INCI2816.1.p1 GENE.INCI2816.1~~INCI2816.1.p1  ORF type:complete len:273 (+),score=24.57 INCI2816.1:162-980(+)